MVSNFLSEFGIEGEMSTDSDIKISLVIESPNSINLETN